MTGVCPDGLDGAAAAERLRAADNEIFDLREELGMAEARAADLEEAAEALCGALTHLDDDTRADVAGPLSRLRELLAVRPGGDPDSCRPAVLPDGEVLRVRGAEPPSERVLDALARVTAAARRLHAEMHADDAGVVGDVAEAVAARIRAADGMSPSDVAAELDLRLDAVFRLLHRSDRLSARELCALAGWSGLRVVAAVPAVEAPRPGGGAMLARALRLLDARTAELAAWRAAVEAVRGSDPEAAAACDRIGKLADEIFL